MYTFKKYTKNKWPKFSEPVQAIIYALTLISAGFAFGGYFKSTQLDNEKFKLERITVSLKDSVEVLQSLLRTDSISKKNWLIQNVHPYSFNLDTFSLPVLSISNSSLNPCVQGKIDGCWGTTTRARVGDIVSLQISYRNTGTLPVNNVSLGYSISYENDSKTIICKGGIAVGNEVVLVGISHIFLKEPAKMSYLPELTRLIHSAVDTGQVLKADTAFGNPNFKIGSVPINTITSSGALLIRFRVNQIE